MFKRDEKKDILKDPEVKYDPKSEKNDIKIKTEFKDQSNFEVKNNRLHKFELDDLKESKINALSNIQAQNNSLFIS